MEKIYNLSEETEYFKTLMDNYLNFHQSCYTTKFINTYLCLDYYELLRFAIHHAECGENVYILNFPKIVPVPNRPDTLFFLEKWSDFLDISELEHALVLSVYDKNTFTSESNLSITYTHIQERFKSFICIGVGA